MILFVNFPLPPIPFSRFFKLLKRRLSFERAPPIQAFQLKYWNMHHKQSHSSCYLHHYKMLCNVNHFSPPSNPTYVLLLPVRITSRACVVHSTCMGSFPLVILVTIIESKVFLSPHDLQTRLIGSMSIFCRFS